MIIPLDIVFPGSYNERVSYELNPPPLQLQRTRPPLLRRCGAIPKRQVREGLATPVGASRPTITAATMEESPEENRDKMSLLRGQGSPLYVSAKRTQIISREKPHLFNTATMGYAIKECIKYLASFWKTNPILRDFWGFERRELTGLEHRFMPQIPKLTPTHPTINVTRHAEC